MEVVRGVHETAKVTIRLLVDADRRACARIYVTGLFDEEILPMVTRHNGEAEAIFSEIIHPSTSTWVAESDGGDIVGFALCQEISGSSASMVNWGVLRRHLPLAATVRAWIVSRYLYNVEFGSDVMYLQSLVVDNGWQRQGIGERLVRTVCHEARRRGYRAVTLGVVDRNDAARRLYERLGFRKVGTTPARLYRPLVGWSSVASMEKLVS